MKNVKPIFLLLAFFVSQSAFAIFDDVSINPKTGETFIVEIQNNPNGEVLLLNDFDETFRQTFQLLEEPVLNAKFEIELTNNNILAYLIQNEENWVLGTLIKNDNGQWVKQPAIKNISGKGNANNLKTLPDGNLTFTIDNQVVIVKSNPTVGLKIAEAITTDADIVNREIIEKVESLNTVNATHMETPENPSSFDKKNGVGFSAGAITGVGFAYRRHLTEKWGMQVAGIFFGDGGFIFANLGVTAMRTLHQTQKVRFYVVSGLSAFYNGSHESDWEYCDNQGFGEDWNAYDQCMDDNTDWNNGVAINFGIGIGIEFLVAKNVGLSFELPLTIMMFVDEDGVDDVNVLPIPSASLIYYF